MVMRSFLTVKVKQTERNEKRKGENEFIILLNATKIDFKDKCMLSQLCNTYNYITYKCKKQPVN